MSKILFALLFISAWASAEPSEDLSCNAQLCSKSLAESRFRASIVEMRSTVQSLFEKNPDFATLEPGRKAELIIGAGLRIKTFLAQSLGRMYRESDKGKISGFANDFYIATKQIEDSLGRYDMLKSVGRTDELIGAAKKIVEAMTRVGAISATGVGPIFDDWSQRLEGLPWLRNSKDRKFVIGELMGQLQKVQSTNYDVSRLQVGLHELRRELRWFLMYAHASHGLVVKANEGRFLCAQKELFFGAYVDPKYSQLLVDASVERGCEISACLFDEVVGAVGAFGQLKDKAEVIVEQDEKLIKRDRTPENLLVEAKQHYKTLRDSKILSKLREQLKNCL